MNLLDEFSKIKKLDKAYQKGKPLIDDGSFDTIYSNFVTYINNHPDEANEEMKKYINYAEPDINLDTKKIKHPYHIISLAKSQTIDGVKKYLSKWNNKDKKDTYYTDKFVVERKEDGLTAVLYFNDKRMPSNFIAVTRGGGKEGQDITNKIYNFANLNINDLISKIGNSHLVVRGEAMIDDADFNKMNKNNEFANSRNAASGTLIAKDDSLVKERNMKFYAYSVINKEDFKDKSELDYMHMLDNLGFEVTGDIHSFNNDEKGKEELVDFINNFDSNKRNKIGHAIDGLVIKPNYTGNLDKIGYTGHHPNSDIAFKFKAEQEVAKLARVEWQKSINGKLTPVGILDHPINILGATISKASLASIKNIEERDIMLNDNVIVRRSNDVIPQITKSIKELRNGSEIDIHTLIPKDAIRKGAVLYAPVDRDEQLIESWNRLVSPLCFNLNGISEKVIKELYNNNLIDLNDFSSIYYVNKNKFIQINGLGEKTYNKMMAQLKDNQPKLSNLLQILPVEDLGEKLATEVANILQVIIPGKMTNDEMIDKVWNVLKNKNGFGNHTKEILNNLFTNDNMNLLYSLYPKIELKEPLKKNKIINGKLSNKHFVITGKFDLKRKDIEKIIVDNGGTIDKSLNKNTTYLLKNGNKESNKTKKANKLGIDIINWDEFNNML